MPRNTVVNPFGALRKVSDFRTFKSDDNDVVSPFATEAVIVRANATILRGEVVSWVVPTATVPISVTPMAIATVGSLFAGIATHGAVAGEDVEIVTKGFALVDMGTQAVVFGSPLIKPTTDQPGKAKTATLDATTVVGTVIGVALQVEDAVTNLVAACIEHM